jgi:hypothetical protein
MYDRALLFAVLLFPSMSYSVVTQGPPPSQGQLVSTKYGFGITLPAGWTSVSTNLMNQQMFEQVGPATQKIMQQYPIILAFQRGQRRNYIERPFCSVQSVPSGWHGLPTDAQFDMVIKAMSSGAAVLAENTPGASIFGPAQTKELRTVLGSISNGSMHVDVPKRRFWRVTESVDPAYADVRAFVAGLFLNNGNSVFLYCYSNRDDFDSNFHDFVMVNQSLHDLADVGSVQVGGAADSSTDSGNSTQTGSAEEFLSRARANAVASLKGQLPDAMLSDPSLLPQRLTVPSHNEVNPSVPSGTSDPRRTVYYEQLGQIILDWRRINENKAFLKWLDVEPIPGGPSRRQQLLASYNAADATASARIFERWIMDAEQPMPFMRREDLLRVGAVTFDDACRSCHTLADATRLAASYSLRMQKNLGKETFPPTSVALFFTGPPDNQHRFSGRGSFEVAGLVTLLTESAFGSGAEPMQAGAIEVMIEFFHTMGQPTRLDQPAGSTTASNRTDHSGGVRDWTSDQFGYAILIPSSWRQIPVSEIVKFKREHLPTMAQKYIFETAFQREFDGQWFQRPYVFLQITPSSTTKLSTLPTDQEFLAVANTANMRKAASSQDSRISIAASPDPKDIQVRESARASFESVDVQFDINKHKYWFTGEAQDGDDVVDIFSLSTFLSNGNVVQINAFSDARDFKAMMPEFRAMGESVRSMSVATAQR